MDNIKIQVLDKKMHTVDKSFKVKEVMPEVYIPNFKYDRILKDDFASTILSFIDFYTKANFLNAEDLKINNDIIEFSIYELESLKDFSFKPLKYPSFKDNHVLYKVDYKIKVL